MNLFRNKLNVLVLLGDILSYLGGFIFVMTFWFTGGVYMAGDAFAYGSYISELALFFPISGIGVLLVFFGRFLSRKNRIIPLVKLFLIFLFLTVLILKSLWAQDVVFQLSMFAVWGIAFFSVATFDFWYLDFIWKKLLLFLGLCVGFFSNYLNLVEGVSVELLGIIAFILAISLVVDKEFRGRQLLLIFCSFIIFYSLNTLLIVLALITFFSQKIWLNRTRKTTIDLGLLPGGFILSGLLIWGIFTGILPRNFEQFTGYLIPLFSDFKLILFGIGDGQLISAIINYSGSIILPVDLNYHHLGLINSFYEKGLVLILVLLALVIYESRVRYVLWPSLFFILFWFFTQDFLQNPNGILLAVILLFAKKWRG